MREDDLWRYQQYLRRLQEYLLDLNVVWNDNAAREISIRYLHPQEEDAQHLNQHLMALKRSISKAEEQMLTVRTEAPEASRLSEQIAELAGDFYVEEKTSYEHVELSVQSRAHAASLFNLVQHFIEKANASCTNVGGGSAGESIWMATRDADKINSKSILLNTSMKSSTTTVVEFTDESDKKTILSSMSTEGIETQSIVVKVVNNDKNIFSIDHLEPNMNYTENGYIFTTNNESQVSRIQGRLQLQTAPRNKKSFVSQLNLGWLHPKYWGIALDIMMLVMASLQGLSQLPMPDEDPNLFIKRFLEFQNLAEDIGEPDPMVTHLSDSLSIQNEERKEKQRKLPPEEPVVGAGSDSP